MNKKLPTALTLFNVLVSGLSSYNTWPLRSFADLEIESVMISIVGAAIGTTLAYSKVVNRRLVPLMISCGIVFTVAITTYSYILAQPGATIGQIYFALFLFFALFLIFFYVITYLERTLLRSLQTKTSRNVQPRSQPNKAGTA